MPRIGIVAGEASGDLLGAYLIKSIKKFYPDIKIEGIGGYHLRQAGCHSLYPIEKLSVIGISEVFGRYFQLLKILLDLKRYFLKNPPDVFIGVDAPDFNFPLEKALRTAGIKTIHYVSPSIWAWREYRLKNIAYSVDLMLTLFPFETSYYEKHDIPVKFIGHPLAGVIAMAPDKADARRQLNLDNNKPVLAVMPGSRYNEIKRLTETFLQAAMNCQARYKNIKIIVNLVDNIQENQFLNIKNSISTDLDISVYTGKSLEVLQAADVILLASGTVALEAMLMKRPMVVAYKVNWMTFQIVRRLIRIPYVSLPNILAGKMLVPECLQAECNPERLAREVIYWLENPEAVSKLVEGFTSLHQELKPLPEDIVADTVMNT